MGTSKEFYDLLFEMSNEVRHEVLLSLKQKELKITEISKRLQLNNPEARRHISRLRDIGLIIRDVEGFYHLTPFGETMLVLLPVIDFMSTKKDYFRTHTPTGLPEKFIKRIGDLGESIILSNAIDFFSYTEALFKESNEFIMLLVDQFPLNSISSIVDAFERGVKLKIIEPRDRIINPNIDILTSEGAEAAFLRAHEDNISFENNHIQPQDTSKYTQRVVDRVNVCLFLSENRCVIAFPTSNDKFDYTGFTVTDNTSLKWCMELFQHYWDEASQQDFITSVTSVKLDQVIKPDESENQVLVIGKDNPEFDSQAIQQAVNNYDEVQLQGEFNLGTGYIEITKSVIIRGQGRENDIPTTKIYKRGWTFPSYEGGCVFEVNGDGIDVTIENIHVTDFNYCCILTTKGRKVRIQDNRITLPTGLGRGTTFTSREDYLTGIIAMAVEKDNFQDGIIIERNYLDFETGTERGGYFTRRGLMSEPEYRPDLKNHEGYCGAGIVIHQLSGKVVVRDNVIRNMNSRGVSIVDNYDTAKIIVEGNSIVSEIYGAYGFSDIISGVGIFVQSSWNFPRHGSCVKISDNSIICNKLNYCGVAVYGPSMFQEGAGKLQECIIKNNEITLEDGSVGILFRKTDNTKVTYNSLSGHAYYGIQFYGSRNRNGFDLASNVNLIKNNEMSNLNIKAPDDYSDNHVDGRMFTGSGGKSETAHVWLNMYSSNNVIEIKTNETIIDEGKNNLITFQ